MTYEELKKKTHTLYPALLLENLISYKMRRGLRHVLFWLFVVIILIVLATLVPFIKELIQGSPAMFLIEYTYNIRGLMFITFALWSMAYLLEMLYFSYYFKDAPIDFEVGQIIIDTDEGDVTAGFLESRPGQRVMERLGIGTDDVVRFLKERSGRVVQNEYITPSDVDEDAYISLAEYGSTLIHFDQEFRNFLIQRDVTAELFTGTLGWISDQYTERRRQAMWWSKEQLAKLPSLGRDWSYGKIYLLEKYGYSILSDDSYVSLGNKWKLYEDSILKIERALSKHSSANVLLTSQHEFNAREAISSFAKTITKGVSLPLFEDKRIFILDGAGLIDSMREKIAFETALHNIFAHAAMSGNVILVIPRFVQFNENAHSIGSDVNELLNQALTSERLQVIVLADTSGYHGSLETNGELLHHFEKITVQDVPEERLMDVAFNEVSFLESHSEIFFTYQSLHQVVLAAERYFTEDDPALKIKDILQEVVGLTFSHGQHVVTEHDVNMLVASKTGIPQGEASGNEISILQNLESELKQRVVGQDDALQSVSSALKRNRAGIGNAEKPIGTFLFLGSTGVGKTETVKALAESYFHSEKNINRFDMSEFSEEGAVERLLGSNGATGLLTTKLRDHQYGIVLLDEFEKAAPEVHDIFLQILDEGFVTDGRGDRVNARNSIFIATSNAGGEFIQQAAMKGESVVKQKSSILNYITNEHIFRSELLNRFDDIVIFKPLGNKQLERIARLQVDSLNKRLESRGIIVEADQNVIEYLVSKGNDIRFGAREINRIVKDVIETTIADAMLSQVISSGDTARVLLDPADPDKVVLEKRDD